MSTSIEALQHSGNATTAVPCTQVSPTGPVPVEPGRHKTRKDRGQRSFLSRLVSVLTNVIMVVATLAILALAIGPHVFGYRTSTMLTGSMSPGINPGDVVVTVPRPANEVAVGDVISYRIPIDDQRVETHRITEVTKDVDGNLAIRTKGDANDAADPWLAHLDGDTVWEVKTVVPHLGDAIRVLRAPFVQHGAFWSALVGFVPVALKRIWRNGEVDGDANGL